MLESFATNNYRSLRELVVPLARLNVVTGPNGSGKSNLYRSLRLLATLVSGGLISALAREGGLDSAFWAGPESFSKDMRSGIAPIQGGTRQKAVRLRVGFAGEEFGYAISLGLPPPPDRHNPDPSFFHLDPEIKRECIWAGPIYRPTSCLVDRSGPVVKVRDGRKWRVYPQTLNTYDSILSEIADPIATPEIFSVRHTIFDWRFYDSFRTDFQSKIRVPQIGTRTHVLDHDGNDLIAALRTIYEIGDRDALYESIEDAFPGASIDISVDEAHRFSLMFNQQGLLRSLDQSELSDGTLRYLLLVAALLTPRPPSLMVLNEPETSLHPDLLPALARLIKKTSKQTQVWVISHSSRLVAALEDAPECHSIALEKELGETRVRDRGLLDTPAWAWPD